MLGATAFGDYAIALVVGALVSVLATGGFSQAVGRMESVDSERLSTQFAFALLFGAVGAVVLVATSPATSLLWRTPSAQPAIAVMGASALVAPLFALLTGLERREGRFARLSVVILSCNVLGFISGIVAVLQWRESWTLIVSPVVAMLGPVIFFTFSNRRWTLTRASLVPRLGKIGELRFGSQVTVSRLLSFLNWNIGRYAVTIVGGAAALGFWNRADTLTGVPFAQAQGVVTQTVYPEFRHDISSPERARRVWPDLLGLAAWGYWPCAALIAVFGPPALTVLLGSAWGEAANIIPVLAILGGMQGVLVLLGSAIEALGRFRLIWLAQLVFFSLQLASAALTFATGRWVFILYGLVATVAIQHLLHIWALGRSGHLDVTKLSKNYLYAAIAAILTGLISLGVVTAWQRLDLPVAATVSVALIGLPAILGWKARNILPPVQIARRYGIF